MHHTVTFSLYSMDHTAWTLIKKVRKQDTIAVKFFDSLHHDKTINVNYSYIAHYYGVILRHFLN